MTFSKLTRVFITIIIVHYVSGYQYCTSFSDCDYNQCASGATQYGCGWVPGESRMGGYSINWYPDTTSANYCAKRVGFNNPEYCADCLRSCSPGSYSLNCACNPCPAGKKCDGTSAPITCSPGSFSTQGQSACTICNAGSFCIDGMQTTCAIGTFAGSGQSICQNCSNKINNSKYINFAVNNSCAFQCNDGFYFENNNCIICPNNAICTTTAFTCNSGYYKNDAICNACVENAWCTQINQFLCPNNSQSQRLSTKQSDCACNPGYFNPNSTCIGCSCIPCAPGTFNSMANATACSLCPIDTYSTLNSTTCTDCPTYSYTMSTGSTSCVSCDTDLDL